MIFKNYTDQKDEENGAKLRLIHKILSGNKKIELVNGLEESVPYLFIKIPNIGGQIQQRLKDLDIDLGVRIFGAGDKIVYRIQTGPKGVPVGPSKVLGNARRLEELLEAGEDPTTAYEEVYRGAVTEIAKYLVKVFKNIDRSRPKPPQTDWSAQRAFLVLHSIVASL